ncbi:hypothetical protein BMS3Abin01_00955 [bacterium BMS3Abin01]|nr:hypothetical protein BMS3Abin01_00955 [bacterium BMS3Abin01]
MKKGIAAGLFLVLLLIGAVVVTAGCGQSESEKAQANYDKAKADLKSSVQELQKPETYQSVDSLKASFQDVQKAYDDTVESGKDLTDAKVSEVQDAYEELQDSINDIDSDQTLEQKVDALRAAIQKFSDQLKQI